jgi:hypothetical protein
MSENWCSSALGHNRTGTIAFFNRPIAQRYRKLVAYERELIGVIQVVKHWRPYLWGRQFRIKTGHYSLKYLLDQRLVTLPQHYWVTKLLGYDFKVEYKPSLQNTATDALSRRYSSDPTLMAISYPELELYEAIKQGIIDNEELSKLFHQITTGTKKRAIVNK